MPRIDEDEVWCRKNVSAEESVAFFRDWSETQWGMPTFGIMRQSIIARRALTSKGAGE